MEKRLTADLNVVANSNLEIQMLDGDLNIIQKLDDEPNDVGGLTSAELKAKFDEGGNIIKKYINETLIPAVLTEDATEESRKQAEAARVAAEQGRVTAEEGRVSAETARAAAEQARSEAEASRVSAENAREAAETARADETAGIVARATAQANAAAGSASQAAGSEQSAKDAAGTATGAASSASQSAAAASGSASQASAAAAAAAQSAASVDGINKTAQSWAVGGTGTRPGEDTDNAKYWAQQAQAAAGGDFATKVEAQGYVTEHNESDAAHPDIREALNGKAAGTHASQHGKDGADPITPEAIGAASLGADGKVPTSQLPETDTYTKDEILKGSTAALLGLGTDAVPDDAFKKIWDKTAVSTKQVHVDFADMLLSGVTGTPSNILTNRSTISSSALALSYNVTNIIKPNDLVTIITTPAVQLYKLADEEQWHSVDFTKVSDSPDESNILFDYDGEYFYCILSRRSSQISAYAAGLDLKKTKDFKTFETIASYYTNVYRTYMFDIYYHINGQLYLSFNIQSSSSSESHMYCAVSRTALSFSSLTTSFTNSCGLFGTYDYKLGSTTVSSNQVILLQKRNVLTGETATLQVPVSSTQKYVIGSYCVPIFIEDTLYLFLTSSSNIPNIFSLSPNYVHCLVSHDSGNTFEGRDFSSIFASSHVVLKYNSISQKLYARTVQTHEIFEFKNGTFEKSDMDPTWWYYDYSAVHSLDETTMVYALLVSYRSGSSGSTYQLPMTFKVNDTIEMLGTSQSANVQLMTLSGDIHDINFDAVAVTAISNSGKVYVGGASPVAGVFASQEDAVVFSINQMYSYRSLNGNVVTISTMPKID